MQQPIQTALELFQLAELFRRTAADHAKPEEQDEMRSVAARLDAQAIAITVKKHRLWRTAATHDLFAAVNFTI